MRVCVGGNLRAHVPYFNGDFDLSPDDALEIVVPLGGRFMYGLLGCEVLGATEPTLDVLVPTFDERKERFDNSLAGDLDVVWWGLPHEYGDAVLRGAIGGIRAHAAPQAESVRFSFAAHGEVGSAVSIFERLASSAIALLVAPEKDVADLPATLERLLAR